MTFAVNYLTPPTPQPPIAGIIAPIILAAGDGKLDLKRSIDDLMSAGFRLSKKEYAKIVFGAMDM